MSTKRLPYISNQCFIGIVCFLVICSCIIRLYDLGSKTMMHDELLFSYYTLEQLHHQWSYKFQPILHGPLVLHLTNLTFHLFGVSDFSVRLVSAITGILVVPSALLFRPYLSRPVLLAYMVLLTFSPGLVFFSRFLHMDMSFLLITQLIVFLHFKYHQEGESSTLILLIISWFILASVKSSFVFIAFSFFTFHLITLFHGLFRVPFPEKSTVIQISSATIQTRVFLFVLLLSLWSLIFEGIRFDADVIAATGHDSPLAELSLIKILFSLDEQASLLRLLLTLFMLLIGYCSIGFYLIARRHLRDRSSHAAFGSRFSPPLINWVIGVGCGTFLFSCLYTTGFMNQLSPFTVLRDTFSYWGGQHAWGRIAGPFHLHLLNMLIYDTMPLLLLFLGALCLISGRGPFRVTALTFFGISVVMAILLFFAVSLFSEQFALILPILLVFSLVTIIFAILAYLFQERLILVILLYPLLLLIISLIFLQSTNWTDFVASESFNSVRDSNSARLERIFNIDGGWQVTLVLILVFFGLLWTFYFLSQGRRFLAFHCWFLLTSIGAAAYAREGVPQVGIHALPSLYILSAIAFVHFLQRFRNKARWILLVLTTLGLIVFIRSSLILNFQNANDPRERYVYAPTAAELKEQMIFINHYVDRMEIQLTETSIPLWKLHPNQARLQREPIVGMLPISHVVWPARWYLRDIPFREHSSYEEMIAANYLFLYLEPKNPVEYPGLVEKYFVFRSRSHLFWIPPAINPRSWFQAIPTFLPETLQSGINPSSRIARQEMRWVIQYYFFRTIPEHLGPYNNGLSSSDYLFAIRRDVAH